MKIEIVEDSTSEILAEFEIDDDIVANIIEQRNIDPNDDEAIKEAVKEVIMKAFADLEKEIDNEVE